MAIHPILPRRMLGKAVTFLGAQNMSEYSVLTFCVEDILSLNVRNSTLESEQAPGLGKDGDLLVCSGQF